MNALTLKNLLREIKRTFTKFLSIFAICALGVAFFAGIRATSPDMKEAGDRLYNTYNLSDISVISTSGLTADNIRDLESIEGIQAVRASLFVDAMARGTGEKEKNLRLYSMPIKLKSEYAPLIDLIPDYGIDTSPEYEMNGVEIVSGRMPLNDTETALDYTLEGSLVKQLGDEITLTTSGGTVTLRVVGFIRSPMYISMFERGTSSIGNGTSDGFAYASGNAISSLGTKLPVMSLLNTYYTRADIVISGKEGLSAYSDEYEALVNEVTDRIEDYASTQSGTWYIQDRSGNPGYSDYSENTDRIAAVGDVFPLIFFIVAALVCLTTMTRMVEEQRIEMGTMKALGYGGWQIAMKYAVYAMSACISGGVVGAIIGFKLFPPAPQSGADGRVGNAKELGDLLAGVALVIVQKDRHTVFLRQRHHSMKEFAVLRRFERKLFGIIIDRLRPLPRREERPLALVDRNADEPVPDVVLALKRFVRAVELEQHLLRDVVRFRAAFGVVERQPEHRVHILFCKIRKLFFCQHRILLERPFTYYIIQAAEMFHI